MVNWTEIQMDVKFNKEACLTQAQRQTRWDVYKNLRQQHDDTYNNNFVDADVFHVIRPQPENDNSHLWRQNNWGTRWELHDTCLDFSPEGGSDLDGTFIIIGQVGNYIPTQLLDYMESIGFHVKTRFVGRPLNEPDISGRLVWGDWETGFGRAYNLVCELDDNMLDDEIKEELNELKNVTRNDLFKAIMCLTLFGDFDVEHWSGEINFDSYNETSFFREILDEQLLNNLGVIETYINQSGINAEDIEKAKQLRLEYLEKIEILMEDDKIDEGKYLEYCNMLRDVDVENADALLELNNIGYSLEAIG